MPGRSPRLIALILGGLVGTGCTRDHSRITPTTTGTDLRNMPRGRMTPLPFPGSSLARAAPAPKLDPATATAAAQGETAIRR